MGYQVMWSSILPKVWMIFNMISICKENYINCDIVVITGKLISKVHMILMPFQS